jgi:hypothetical protein
MKRRSLFVALAVSVSFSSIFVCRGQKTNILSNGDTISWIHVEASNAQQTNTLPNGATYIGEMKDGKRDTHGMGVVHLEEMPKEFRGEFLVGTKIVDGKIENVPPAAFGTIEAKRVLLANGDMLRVASISQLTNMPTRVKTFTVVSFEGRDFRWSIQQSGLGGNELMVSQIPTNQTRGDSFVLTPKRSDKPPAPSNWDLPHD